jgi:S1-C subfamily serine protease
VSRAVAILARCIAAAATARAPAANRRPRPAHRTAAKVGVEYVQLTIKKPLGLVLSEKRPSGEVYVEEIVADGNAAATGLVRVGDILTRTSATVLKSSDKDTYGKQGHGDRLYDSWETVEFECAGQDFATVMSAIGSNNER